MSMHSRCPNALSAPARIRARSLAVATLALALFAPEPAAAAPPAPAIRHVDIKGFAFAPLRIEVHAGDIVEFTNRDLAPHTASDDTNKWRTPSMKSGASVRLTFPTAGTFAYHCAFHPQMKAIIVVQEAK